jgi:predicted alpha/beta-hydrolase family hydrolase
MPGHYSPQCRFGFFTTEELRGHETKDTDLTDPSRITIELNETLAVSGLMVIPPKAIACLVVAHGAGAGMNHAFLEAVSSGLAHRRVASLRYQFPYMEQGSKRTDRPALAHATVRAAVNAATKLAPLLPLFAGGKSFGGRMTSQTQAEAPLPHVLGLVFLGFPLHPANKPSDDRALHLADIGIPMLFLQGTRDALADKGILASTLERFGGKATLISVEGADHSFHVPVRSGNTDNQVLSGMLDDLVNWMGRYL